VVSFPVVLSVWIVTAVGPEPSVHFVIAGSFDRAQDLVVRRTHIRAESLSVVKLREDFAPVPQSLARKPGVERYLGPLEKFSPYLRADCSLCRGTGKVIGSRPPELCPVCGGTGLKTTRS